MLGKINNTRNKNGFTIVELLIVIVVIGILAAITIVAYGGITTRANTTKAQTNASSVQKVAESYNADSGYYPATLANFASGFGATPSSKLPGSITLSGTTDPTSANGTTNIRYQYCGNVATPTTIDIEGGRVAYYSFSGTIGVTYVYTGSASPANWANGAAPCWAAVNAG